MKNAFVWIALLLVCPALAGCGVDNSVEMPDNPDPMPAGISTGEDAPNQAPPKRN